MSLNKRLISGEEPEPGPARFRPLLFTGNGGTKSVTGMGFKPDLVWIKDRDTGYQHNLYANSGGTGAAGWALEPNGTPARYSLSGLTGFNSDGFTVGSNAGNNQSSSPNISYGWRIADSDEGDDFNTNSSGDINASYQIASSTVGMSTFVYTGSGNGGDTIGHGLSAAPEVVIIKKTSGTENWYYQSETQLGNWNQNVRLDSTNAVATSTTFVTGVSSSLITLGTSTAVNGSSTAYFGWAMHSVDKFSKYGYYTGNGSTTGPTVTLGFKPALLIIKRVDSGDNWLMFDSARHADTNNNLAMIINGGFRTESVGNLGDGYNFLSNGFQCVSSDSGVNANNGKYIYMAWADNGD